MADSHVQVTVNKNFLYREPISIIKVLSLPLCLMAVLTIMLYDATLTVKPQCVGGSKYYSISWGYPINLAPIQIARDLCQSDSDTKLPHYRSTVTLLNENHSGIAITWTIFGCLTLVYLVVFLCVQLFFWGKYSYGTGVSSLIAIDLLSSTVLCLVWLINTVILFVAVASVQNNTSYESLTDRLRYVNPCRTNRNPPDFDDNRCSLSHNWLFGILWVAPIAGVFQSIALMIHSFLIWRKITSNREMQRMRLSQIRQDHPSIFYDKGRSSKSNNNNYY